MVVRGMGDDRAKVSAGAFSLADVQDILLVEDDDRVVEAVRARMALLGIQVHHAGCVSAGKRLLNTHKHFDVIVLDLSLPDGDGASVADQVRAGGFDTPIIMVTANDSINDRISGLARGADDYLCKPFSVDELVARIAAIMRRTRRAHDHVLTYSNVKLDLMRRHVSREGKETELSSREVDLLAFFMAHPDEILTQDRIFKEVWGLSDSQDSGVLRVYTNYLRNKLGQPKLIFTVRNVGYVFSTQDPEDGPASEGSC